MAKLDKKVAKYRAFRAGMLIEILDSYECRENEQQGIDDTKVFLRETQQYYSELATEDY